VREPRGDRRLEAVASTGDLVARLRCSIEAQAIAGAIPRQVAQIVRLRSERARQAVRADSSFAEKQESPPAPGVVVLAVVI
jgi:hypothetical protein